MLLDIIYSSQAYNVYEGIEFSPITAQTYRFHFVKKKQLYSSDPIVSFCSPILRSVVTLQK